MIKLKIIKKDGALGYTLQNLDDGKSYKLNMEFIDVSAPNVNDLIALDESLLSNTDGTYVFGNIESEYGRTITNADNPDLIFVDIKGKTTMLKRLYG